MSTNTQNRSRTPAGVPSGGQFAVERRGEATTATLAAPSPALTRRSERRARAALRDASAADRRLHAILRSDLARAVRDRYPEGSVTVIGRHEDYERADQPVVLGVVAEDGTLLRGRDDLQEDAEDDPVLSDAIDGVEASGSWETFSEELRFVDTDRYLRDESFAEDQPMRVVLPEDARPGLVEPKTVGRTPSDPFFADTDGADGWSPILTDDGTGYRHDVVQIEGGRPRSGPSVMVVDESEQAKIEAIAFQEDCARARGELD